MKEKNINIYEYLSDTINLVDEIKQTRLQSASKIYNDSVNIWECYSRDSRDIKGYTASIWFQVIKHKEKYIFANYITSYTYEKHIFANYITSYTYSDKKTLVHSKYISEATAKELIATLHSHRFTLREKKDVYTQEEIETLSKELEEATKMAEEA